MITAIDNAPSDFEIRNISSTDFPELVALVRRILAADYPRELERRAFTGLLGGERAKYADL